jgi:hypothetical protein
MSVSIVVLRAAVVARGIAVFTDVLAAYQCPVNMGHDGSLGVCLSHAKHDLNAAPLECQAGRIAHSPGKHNLSSPVGKQTRQATAIVCGGRNGLFADDTAVISVDEHKLGRLAKVGGQMTVVNWNGVFHLLLLN